MDERRRYPRIPVTWPVRLWIDEECLIGRATDASAYGICVVTAPTAGLRLGQSYRVEVMAGMADAATYSGEVRHISDHGAGFETTQPIILT
jgi:hypothetical protein